MRASLIAALTAAVLVACGTPYQPAGQAGGFSESWRSKTVVVIDFKGNGFTSSEEVRDMALLRAAELAKAHEWGYFRVIGDADASTTAWIPGMTRSTKGGGMESNKPGVRIMVAMLGVRDISDPSIYDADEVIRRLGHRYKR